MRTKVPSDRNRALVARHAQGDTLKDVGRDFHIKTREVKRIIEGVRRFDRGLDILEANPTSFLGLELTGNLPARARQSLEKVGIRRVEDLEGLTEADLLKVPDVGRGSAKTLLDLHGDIERKKTDTAKSK
jgi:hypothetical protein